MAEDELRAWARKQLGAPFCARAFGDRGGQVQLWIEIAPQPEDGPRCVAYGGDVGSCPCFDCSGLPAPALVVRVREPSLQVAKDEALRRARAELALAAFAERAPWFDRRPFM